MHSLDINIIETHNSKTIAVADSSIYDPDLAITNPSLEITPPNGFNKVTRPFTPNSINTLNTNSAGITNACNDDLLAQIPDGIWTFKYSVNPNISLYIVRSYLRTTLIECKLQRALISVLTETKNTIISQDKQKNGLLDIQILIDGAISAANMDNISLANDLYTRANALLDKFNKGKCNNCDNYF